ncbi:MAG: GNAT family N-acetyltransferase [Gammaproteobacteria bacterium HGW-Gammaproteobacteria-15]|nr:MAG: GNAT family N-acetyltransferase [Gammaproteobacteria bacterium HGW-Gammaproteobacteria-15]
MKIHSRPLNDDDFKQMRALLLTEGANEWNYITDESIEQQFDLIREEKALAVLAEEDGIFGFAVLMLKSACPSTLSKYSELSSIAYIGDVVVSLTLSGKGIGSELLNKCVGIAREEQCREVYIERHEENLASAGMMRKAGFELVETFYDPDKRFVGSRKTSVLVKCP